jgi:hypothetical protein
LRRILKEWGENPEFPVKTELAQVRL